MWLGPRLLEGFSRRRLFGLSLICAGAFLVLLALVPSLVAAVLFTVVIGACGGVAWVTGYTLLGLEVDDEVRGRTFAVPAVRRPGRARPRARRGPAIAAPIGTHTLHLARGFTLTYNGAAWVFLLSGVLALTLGLTAYRQMDDRKGVPLGADLLSAWRGRRVSGHRRRRRCRSARPAATSSRSRAETAPASPRRPRCSRSGCRTTRATRCVLTREPGATPLGVRLRELLLGRDEKLDPRTEALLFAADRADHVATMVRPGHGARRGGRDGPLRGLLDRLSGRGRSWTTRHRRALPVRDRRPVPDLTGAARHPQRVLPGAPRLRPGARR
jgi:dTMP kinase